MGSPQNCELGNGRFCAFLEGFLAILSTFWEILNYKFPENVYLINNNTNWTNLVSFKNFNIWTCYRSKIVHIPISGLSFFTLTQPFLANLAQKTIIYRLVEWEIQATRIFSDFWSCFGGKMGVAATLAQKGLGPQKPNKIWPTGRTFLVDCYLENAFPVFWGLNPTLLLINT